MKMPEIFAQKYDLDIDPEINSKVLRAIFEDILELKYEPSRDKYIYLVFDSFNAKYYEAAWGVRIEDKHDDEKTPHYILEVGMGDYRAANERHSAKTRYCDYHSCKNSKGKRVIETAPGKWTIHVWLPKDVAAGQIMDKISSAYKKAMDEALPDYEILSVRIPPVLYTPIEE